MLKKDKLVHCLIIITIGYADNKFHHLSQIINTSGLMVHISTFKNGYRIFNKNCEVFQIKEILMVCGCKKIKL